MRWALSRKSKIETLLINYNQLQHLEESFCKRLKAEAEIWVQNHEDDEI